MFAVESLLALVQQMSGTPYIVGGSSPAGTDCSGLVSMVSNAASGRPAFGDRFHTSNEEAALLERGFQYGTAPDALVIGWNSSHTAATLPDGTPVASGEPGGVQIGGGGAYQPQFTHHMFLPMAPEQAEPGPGFLPEPAPWEQPAPPAIIVPVGDGPPMEEEPPPPPAEGPVFINVGMPPEPPPPFEPGEPEPDEEGERV